MERRTCAYFSGALEGAKGQASSGAAIPRTRRIYGPTPGARWYGCTRPRIRDLDGGADRRSATRSLVGNRRVGASVDRASGSNEGGEGASGAVVGCSDNLARA